MADLIDRQAAIDYLMTNMGWHDEDGYAIDDYNEKKAIITDLINGIPSAEEPERKIGSWVTDDEFIDCSICRREKWSRVPYENLVKRFRYCPNCGTKMVEDDPSHPFADDVMMWKG